MTGKEQFSRRRSFQDAVDPGDITDPGEPIEVPLGSYKPDGISDEIQRQIAIEIAKKGMGERQTPEQIFAELNDLEEDDSSPPWSSQYEYTDMHSEIMGDELMQLPEADDIQQEEEPIVEKESVEREAAPLTDE